MILTPLVIKKLKGQTGSLNCCYFCYKGNTEENPIYKISRDYGRGNKIYSTRPLTICLLCLRELDEGIFSVFKERGIPQAVLNNSRKDTSGDASHAAHVKAKRGNLGSIDKNFLTK